MDSEKKAVLWIVISIAIIIVSVIGIFCYSNYLDTKMHIDAGHEKRMVPSSYREIWVDPKTQAEITP